MMGVSLGGREGFVAHELLNGAGIHPLLRKTGSEGVVRPFLFELSYHGCYMFPSDEKRERSLVSTRRLGIPVISDTCSDLMADPCSEGWRTPSSERSDAGVVGYFTDESRAARETHGGPG